MAKDGTARGGARSGSGKKRKALADKILDGQKTATLPLPELNVEDNLQGSDMPPVSEYMKAEQHVGIPLKAEQVFKLTWEFLCRCGCENKVGKNVIEHYAMNYARWIQCEEAISKYGLLAKHPTTGGAMTSPYVQMSREYSKQSNVTWFQISQIIRENSEVYVDTSRQQADTMEFLLTHNPRQKKA